MDSNDLLKDVRFSNWNAWYQDLAEDIKEIKKIGNLVLFEPKRVNDYYSSISNLVSTVTWALHKPDEILKKLDQIEDNIFSEKYINSLTNDSKITLYQRKIIRMLRNILIIVCEDLSEHGLLPKIEKHKMRNPSKAMAEENY